MPMIIMIMQQLLVQKIQDYSSLSCESDLTDAYDLRKHVVCWVVVLASSSPMIWWEECVEVEKSSEIDFILHSSHSLEVLVLYVCMYVYLDLIMKWKHAYHWLTSRACKKITWLFNERRLVVLNLLSVIRWRDYMPTKLDYNAQLMTLKPWRV